MKVTTSTHTKLHLALDTTAGMHIVVPHLEVNTSTKGDAESHEWTFQMPDGALPVDGKTSGTLAVPPSALAPYGVMHLNYTKAGSTKKASCDAADYDLTTPVRLKGELFFDTKSTGKHKWGTIGSKKVKTTLAGATLDATYGAGGFGCSVLHVVCSAGIQWNADPDSSAIDLYGAHRPGDKPYVGASVAMPLPAPTGAVRDDNVQSDAPPPKLAPDVTGGATLTIRGGGESTGSAMLVSANAGSTVTSDCVHHQTQTLTDWSSSTLVQGNKPLVIHEQIFGPITLATGAEGDFSTSTLSG